MGVNGIVFLAAQVGRGLLIGALSLSASVSARAFEATQEQREACTPDAFRLCSSAIPDVARVTACMEAKKASLSAPCRAVFEAASFSASPHRHRVHKRHSPSAGHRKSHHREASMDYRVSARR